MKIPKVYIVILNWNGWRDTIECLESVLQNTYANFHVIVCDNGSTDSSLDKLRAWAQGKILAKITIADKLGINAYCPKPVLYEEREANNIIAGNKQHFPLTVIKIPENKGFAGGNNIGIKFALNQSDCDYVWLLNNDTVIKNDSLTCLVETAENDHKIGICGSKLMYYTNTDLLQAYGGRLNRYLGTTCNIINIAEIKDMYFTIGASMLVSKEFLQQIGLLEEKYFLYYEELDWAARAKDCFKITCAPNSVVYHKEGASTGANNQAKAQKSLIGDFYGIRSRLLFMKKFYALYMPTVYLGLIVTMIKRILRHQYDRVKMVWWIINNSEKSYVDYLYEIGCKEK